MTEPLHFVNKGEWGQWLAVHQPRAKEVWLVIKKEASKHPGVSIEEAIDEAIAYGWIDGKMKPLDADKYLLRFTPRREDSLWSLRNRKVAERLITERRMKESGIACVEAAKRNGRWDSAYSSLTPPKVPDDLEAVLRESGVLDRFNSMSNTVKLQYIFWIDQSKKPETRAKRIAQVVKKVSP